MDSESAHDARATIAKPRRRYSVINLRLTGFRPLSITTNLRSSPTKRLQVVPHVVDVPFRVESSSSTPTNPSPTLKLTRPLTNEEASSAGPLLPPSAAEHAGKLTLVLDLDETLIHAALAVSEGGSPTPHDFSFLIDDIFGSGQRREVVVWKRPGLTKFLSIASKLAEIVVFTASLKEYAAPLLDIIDPDRVIAARLYRDSAVQTACGVVKDLSLLGRDLSRVVIVDNDPVSFLRHPDNAVLIRSFRGTDEDAADASFAVLQRLLEDLVPLPDVRPALAARFGLRRYFRCISPETAPEICSEIR